MNEVGEEALLLGLLMGSDGDENSAESKWVSFHHKMIQVCICISFFASSRYVDSHFMSMIEYNE